MKLQRLQGLLDDELQLLMQVLARSKIHVNFDIETGQSSS